MRGIMAMWFYWHKFLKYKHSPYILTTPHALFSNISHTALQSLLTCLSPWFLLELPESGAAQYFYC